MGSEPVCQIPLPEEDHIEEVAEIAVSTGIPTDILDVLVDALAHRILSTGAFSSENSLHKAYPQLEYTPRAKMKMERLRIFTVMDVDMDCRSLRSYQTKDMFRDSPFHDRIIPIHNDPNMDEVMSEIGLGVVQNKKIRSYAKMMDDVTDPMDLLRRLEGCDSTNMDLLIRHCLSSRPPYQNQIKPV